MKTPVFLGRKKDLHKLVTIAVAARTSDILGDPLCGTVSRMSCATPGFSRRATRLFADYLRNYRYFVNDFDYRAGRSCRIS
jgi:hypothetical protein